jgi:TolA-binding protein
MSISCIHASIGCLAAAVAFAAAQPVQAGPGKPKGEARTTAQGEIYLPVDEYKLLDRFEAHALDRADKVYSEKKYKQAKAEYETFMQEYPRSRVVPYVLLRIARSVQLDDKRGVAARQFQEVLDYFPNMVRYAAPALYFQGWCHWDSGEEDKAIKAWAAMARHPEYRKHEMAASAINMLADNLVKNGKLEDAARYYWQVAVDCRTTNRGAAEYARDKAMEYYFRAAPSEEQLRKFLRESYTFATPRTSDEEVLASAEYWEYLRRNVKAYGAFSEEEKALKQRFHGYWAKTLDRPIFLGNDDYQIDLINFRRNSDGDSAAWIKRMDELFLRNQNKDDWGRIVRWMGLMAAHPDKCMEYYGKLDLPRMKMGELIAAMERLFEGTKKKTLLQATYQQIRFEKCTNAEIVELMTFIWDTVEDENWAKNVFLKLRPNEMKDEDKAKLAADLFKKSEDFAISLCRNMTDKDLGQFTLLTLYAKAAKNDRYMRKAMELADYCLKVEAYARKASWIKAVLLEQQKKWGEAIAVYQSIDEMPKTLWAIAKCYESWGKLDQAVQQLREIEQFFKPDSVRAAMAIGYLYQRHGQRQLAEASFRRVMDKYRESDGSRDAHLILEGMNVRIKGGMGAAKESDNPDETITKPAPPKKKP